MKDEEMLIAKQKAMNKYPYYGPILARSRVKEDSNIPTMGINNRLCISYNKKFFDSLNEEGKVILVTHEVMHPLSDHHHRFLVNPHKGEISFTIHNIAMDMEINQHLEKDCETDWFSHNGWLPSKMEFPEGKSYEFYLEMIIQEIEQDRKNYPNIELPQMGGNSDNSDSDSPDGNDDKEVKDMSKSERVRNLRIHQDMYEKMKKEINDAIQRSTSNLDMDKAEESDAEAASELQDVINECKEAMKQIGSKHSLSDVIRKIPPKKYNWRQVLRSVISNKQEEVIRGRDKMTFTKVNRRMAGMDSDVIFSEKFSRQRTFNLVVGIDVSGSMGELTTEMYSRLRTLNSQMSDSTSHITVVECDTEISKVMIDFKPYQNTIESTAGGGTDMEEIPRWVEKMVKKERKFEEPDLIVIMTDNYVPWEGKSIYKKKIVVLTDNVTKECPYKQYEVVID